MNNVENFLNKKGFSFALSIDCEGTNFDKNLENNVKNLERLLKLNSENDIYTILFITPFFANMLSNLNLVQRIKQYKVIFGLHIHPDNLPEEIKIHCPFINDEEELLTAYSYEEQKIVIKHCMDYLHNKEIAPIEIFRGGYFSMDDNTTKCLIELTNIRYESHNIYREQYKVTENLLSPLPVYAFDDKEELRLEYFSTEKLVELLINAIKEDKKALGITHSYLLDPEDFHYKRDNIKEDIHFRLNKLIKVINLYKKAIEPIENIKI
ncbi:hypothetical protein BD780_001438 [Clostridium tetanomorphum]|uniref:Polysaccharide deacetylase n=1 Tax=Clostridium tetanomorphum TaxID=1553 RepID=A0A923E9J3_CLOTT|nr:hypothetical protein [Clostridium tetanomorphum]KAJ53134.1 hypothetical protein CTM_03665 [Clostridium tetanomorphum DSM 665]MBC2396929.1 hypothetical protein [Clostridium tetanomorphum]MBP1863104.1 hypothetical protein [Clostridium tetanomorphum]NRS84213.1 hypothetical protein [Clostridium tetanomorphum]NRZ97426.1 hypothetical protein [Clostridium tetanomorphum]